MNKIVCERIEAGDKWPICPCCDKQIEKVLYFEQASFTLVRILVCPHCMKVLGTAMAQ